MDLSRETYETILRSLHDGLYFVDRNRVITFWNRAAEQISGFTADEVVGRRCADSVLTHIDEEGCNLCKGHCPLEKTMDQDSDSEAEVYLHHKDGHRVPVSVRTSPLKNSGGEVIGGVELFTDISNRKDTEMHVRELEEMALLDNLTGLPNRNYTERELRARLEEFGRHAVPFGVVFFDVDFFKKVNDTWGHAAGDAVLQYIGYTFSANSRTFDHYGRWGGEEFIGIIRNVTREQLVSIAERMRMLIKSSYVTIGERRLSVTVSAGATIVLNGDSAHSLVDRADRFLYQSKESGRDRVTAG